MIDIEPFSDGFKTSERANHTIQNYNICIQAYIPS